MITLSEWVAKPRVNDTNKAKRRRVKDRMNTFSNLCGILLNAVSEVRFHFLEIERRARESLAHSTSNRPRDNLIILQLRPFVAAGDQNLRTRMIKRHQQAAIPASNPARVILQVELMIVKQFQGIKGDCS